MTVALGEDVAADDAASEVIEKLLAFIESNPAKSAQWKEAADEKLAQSEQ